MSSWAVIFGRSWAAWTRGSGSGTRWAVVKRRVATSRSVSPCRVAICSTICCCLMLISVRCFRSSSMAGEESPPDGKSTRRKNRTKRENKKKMMKLRWLWVVGDPPAICPHSPPAWRAEVSHDRLLWKQVPGGYIYWTINEVMVPTCLWWFFRASWSCSPAGRVRWVRCPVLVWRADRSTAFWKEIGTNISRLPSGVVSPPQTLCCWGFCSPLLSSLSWDRSVRGDCVQVNFLRCQGDADRCPGHVSHYIYVVSFPCSMLK